MKIVIKNEYEILKKKYTLPNYENINNEFEIALIEHKDFIIRAIQHKIFEKIETYSKFIGKLLQPDTNSISDMNEYGFLDEIEKKELYKFYQQLMKLNREIISLCIENSDEKSALFINKTYKEWPSIKLKMFNLSKKLSESWTKTTKTTFKTDYLG